MNDGSDEGCNKGGGSSLPQGGDANQGSADKEVDVDGGSWKSGQQVVKREELHSRLACRNRTKGVHLFIYSF